MIDLQFEQYRECRLDNFTLVDTYQMQQWMHFIISFDSETPNLLEDADALVITGMSEGILQIILREEGCDSPLFQFTENEKKQISEWFYKEGHGITK